jgi:hypothetical protein
LASSSLPVSKTTTSYPFFFREKALSKERYNTSKIELNISMIIFLVEKVNVNCNTYKNGWIYLLVIITIICYLNFTEPL